jgi:Protein of unknown function (DUF3347)
MTKTSVKGFAAVCALLLMTTVCAAAELPAPLLEAYLKVQTELASDRFQPAIAGAKQVADEAAKAGADAAKVKTAADKIAGAKDIEAARTAFGDLSDAVIALAGGKSPGGDVKVAFCPMARKSWLQKGEAIQNPYYGQAMATCGEIKK